MTNEQIDALIAKLLEEKEKNEKAARDKKVMWPATSELNARFTSFCTKHGIVPNDEERRDIVKIVENLEKRVRTTDPKYRYNPKKAVSNKKGRKNKNDNDLFATK